MENSHDTSIRRSSPWVLLLILASALMARLGGLEWSHRATADRNALQFDDERWYWHIAQSIHRGEGIVGEFGHRAPRMPLYPAYLSCFARWDDGILWAKRVQCLLGIVPVYLVFIVASQALNHRVGLCAAMLVAFDPLLVGACSLLLTETMFVVLSMTMLALWCWANAPSIGSRTAVPPRNAACAWVLFVIASSAAIYTRPSSLLLVAAWLGLHALLHRFTLKSMVTAFAVGLAVFMTLLPWGLRNQRLTGHFTLLDHRAGITLYDGVGPQATGASDLGDIKNSPEVRDLAEADWDAYFRKKAWESIKQDPGRMLRLAVIKLGRMWSPVLNAQEYQSTTVGLIMACWTIPFYLAVLAGMALLRGRWPMLLALLTPTLVLSLVHALYIGSVRYRLGAIPALAILAAVAIASLGSTKSNRTPIDVPPSP